MCYLEAIDSQRDVSVQFVVARKFTVSRRNCRENPHSIKNEAARAGLSCPCEKNRGASERRRWRSWRLGICRCAASHRLLAGPCGRRGVGGRGAATLARLVGFGRVCKKWSAFGHGVGGGGGGGGVRAWESGWRQHTSVREKEDQ